ncbi:MAG TPA: two-component system regulatory protein YycI [Bacillota bacterium]|nr:two-component system regulatory protein YycI [Bacillota bacterium]
MQWGHIKTLFIFCFLILDVYLLFVFLEKQEAADYRVIDNPDTSIEDQLKQEDIDISASLDFEELEESYISVTPRPFADKDLDRVKEFDKQTATVVDKSLLVSRMDEPVQLSEDTTKEDVKEWVHSNILFPEDYLYWNWNKEMNVILFFQKKSGRPVYYNQNGLLLLFLNDDNEILFYTQTVLGEAEAEGEEKKLIEPINAIGELYKSNELYSEDEVTSVDVGFHTMIPLENGKQIFAPTWKVMVNNEKDFFVNAIEGRIFLSDEQEFLQETLSSIADKIKKSKQDDSFKAFIESELEKKMDLSRGGKRRDIAFQRIGIGKHRQRLLY